MATAGIRDEKKFAAETFAAVAVVVRVFHRTHHRRDQLTSLANYGKKESAF